MPTRIFISYRRDDAAAWAGRLHERLSRDISKSRLFMDVDNIAPGLDFVKVLDDQVAQCDVLLAVIGRGWLSATNRGGQRRLDDPDDFVRIEIESALKRDVRVIPILVDGAEMPAAGDLPETLAPLARRNALSLSHARFAGEVRTLIEDLSRFQKPARQREKSEGTNSTPPIVYDLGMALIYVLGLTAAPLALFFLIALLLSRTSLGSIEYETFWATAQTTVAATLGIIAIALGIFQKRNSLVLALAFGVCAWFWGAVGLVWYRGQGISSPFDHGIILLAPAALLLWYLWRRFALRVT